MRLIQILIAILILNQAHSQALEKSNIVINGGMGYPPLGSIFDGNFGAFQDEKRQNIGTFFLDAEVFLTDRIGFRVSNMYAFYKRESQNSFIEYNPNNGSSNQVFYTQTETKHKYRFLVGPNFHLYRTENLDSYFGLGFGVNKQSYNIENSIDPPESTDGLVYNTFNFYSPIAFRISYGLRYFINEFWAISTEFGLGGPLVSIGIVNKVF